MAHISIPDEYFCKWNFAELSENAHERGVNNAMAQHFKSQDMMATIVRESIQNSLDAVLDHDKPVVVNFDFLKIQDAKKYAPNLLKIKDYLQGCMDYWKKKQVRDVYMPKVDYLQHFSGSLPVLRISDYNTIGMDYKEGDNDCTFFAFLRAEGTSVKNNENSGGSFGFGKTAYFMMSPINTILVSSMNKAKESVFEGAAMLCTNKTYGKKCADVGYYDNNNGKPITNPYDIPKGFRRTSPGTDVNILGVQCVSSMFDDIAKAVLLNFWMTIYDEKLEVYIGETYKISKETLPVFIRKYFKEDFEGKGKYANPRPYFEAVVGANEGKEDFAYYEDTELMKDTTLKLYLSRNRYTRDRILQMREPRMMVKAMSPHSTRHYCGVFVCEGVGNKILKEMEPPSHADWDANLLGGRNATYGRAVLSKIKAFIQESVNDFLSGNKEDYLEIEGAAEYLYNAGSARNVNTGNGASAEVESGGKRADNEPTENSYSAPNTDIQSREPDTQLIEKETIGKVTTKTQTKATQKDGGGLLSGQGNKPRKKKDGGQINSPKINRQNQEDENGMEGQYEIAFPVRYRSFAQKESGRQTYTLIINSDRTTDTGVVHVYVVGAELDEEIPIEWSDKGIPQGNAISKLHIPFGRSTIKFRFNDNQKYAIYIEAYEEK